MRIADFIGEVTEYDKKERLVDYKHQAKKLPHTQIPSADQHIPAPVH